MTSTEDESGKLVLVTTPIGNLEDFSSRSIRYLREQNFFAVEDTRSFKSLLNKLDISLEGKEIHSFHDHTDEGKIEKILGVLESGRDVIVISEAGSPLISDPAYPLITQALAAGYEIDSIGSTSAVVCALELSGLHPTPFHFHGFLPREQGKRISYLEAQLNCPGTHIFFEGPSRVNQTVEDLVLVDPKGQFAIARELTKVFQSIYRFTSENYQQKLQEVVWKGEFVILWQNNLRVKGTSKAPAKLEELAREVLESGGHPKKLSKLLSAIIGESPKTCYEQLARSKA